MPRIAPGTTTRARSLRSMATGDGGRGGEVAAAFHELRATEISLSYSVPLGT